MTHHEPSPEIKKQAVEHPFETLGERIFELGKSDSPHVFLEVEESGWEPLEVASYTTSQGAEVEVYRPVDEASRLEPDRTRPRMEFWVMLDDENQLLLDLVNGRKVQRSNIRVGIFEHGEYIEHPEVMTIRRDEPNFALRSLIRLTKITTNTWEYPWRMGVIYEPMLPQTRDKLLEFADPFSERQP